MNKVFRLGLATMFTVAAVPLFGYWEMGRQQTGLRPNLTVEYAGPPNTLEEYVSQSPDIVVGNVESVESFERPNVAGSSMLYTRYSVRIESVLKSFGTRALAVGDVIDVYRLGGAVEKNGKSIHATELNYPHFGRGERFLLFIKDWPAFGGYEILWGPNGVLRVAKGRLQSLGRGRVAAAADGVALEDYVAMLRPIVGKQK